MSWNLENARRSWENLRRVYLAAGLAAEVARMDALLLDDRRALYAPSSWKADWMNAMVELNTALPQAGAIPARVLVDVVEAEQLRGRERLIEAARLLSTPRADLYLRFLLWAQLKLQDGQLSMIADLGELTAASAVGPEHAEAQEEVDPERRARLYAAAITTTMEGYYKPILRAVWRLTARVAGKDTTKCPKECGRVMDQCGHLWTALPSVPRLDEFLDREALEVRNGQAHRSLSYAATTEELIVLDDAGAEKARVNEVELKRRLSEVFLRARTLHLVYFAAIGQLDTVLLPLSA